MPCGGSTQVFAFTTLSATSQLSLASCMTTSALLDFATASPAFNIFLHTHCEEIVLAALRTQYGYIPDTSDWDTCKLLPLYTDLTPSANPHSHLHSHDTPRTIPHTPVHRRHKRGSRNTHEILLELPIMQRLMDEELLSDHGKKLLTLFPKSQQASSIYGPGIRGLLRYCREYTSLVHEGTKRADMHESMQHWLQKRYTNWGISEMEFVVDALSSCIDSLIPSLRNDITKREQLLGSLLYGMELLRLGTNIQSFSEEAILQKLANREIIEFLLSPSADQWKVTDPSHAYWFSIPARNALAGKQFSSPQGHQRRHMSSSESLSEEEVRERQYVLSYAQPDSNWGEEIGNNQLREAPETREPRPSVFDVRIGPIEGIS